MFFVMNMSNYSVTYILYIGLRWLNLSILQALWVFLNTFFSLNFGLFKQLEHVFYSLVTRKYKLVHYGNRQAVT